MAKQTNQTTDINLKGLVADGHLDLVSAFEGADWDQVRRAATYVLRRFGPENEPGKIEVYLQTAQIYGIRAYRWEEVEGESSAPYLSEAEALADAKRHAAEHDESNG